MVMTCVPFALSQPFTKTVIDVYDDETPIIENEKTV